MQDANYAPTARTSTTNLHPSFFFVPRDVAGNRGIRSYRAVFTHSKWPRVRLELSCTMLGLGQQSSRTAQENCDPCAKLGGQCVGASPSQNGGPVRKAPEAGSWGLDAKSNHRRYARLFGQMNAGPFVYAGKSRLGGSRFVQALGQDFGDFGGEPLGRITVIWLALQLAERWPICTRKS